MVFVLSFGIPQVRGRRDAKCGGAGTASAYGRTRSLQALPYVRGLGRLGVVRTADAHLSVR
eukprot:3675070-Pyramimonas_sp.AAC.1